MSAELASIVGAKEGEKMSRSEIIKRLWAYLKKNNLQVLSYPLLINKKNTSRITTLAVVSRTN
jgi:chromatin remodeling complex protein RSC6